MQMENICGNAVNFLKLNDNAGTAFWQYEWSEWSNDPENTIFCQG